MLNGIQLNLMIGPAVPVPAPREVVDALEAVEIMTGEETSGFQLTFTLSTNSPLHTLFMVSGGASIPVVRVVVIATLGGLPDVLIDGVMTNHQVVPGDGPGQSKMVVKGEDLSAVMNWLDFSGVPYPAMPPETRVMALLAKYAVFGIAPVVIPTLFPEVPNPLQQIPRQKGTDLSYIRHLAGRAGYVFHITPGPVPLANVAYWGPKVKIGIPQPALNINMDAHTNVESLTFSYATDEATMPLVYIQEPNTKVPIPIPIPDLSPLSPPLGIIQPIPKKFPPLRDTAKMSPIQAVLRGLAEASKTAEVVTGEGSLDVLRYGRILKARQLVGVRGAGLSFDGLHYVTRVTHQIKRGEYKQSFALERNGLISTVPKVAA